MIITKCILVGRSGDFYKVYIQRQDLKWAKIELKFSLEGKIEKKFTSMSNLEKRHRKLELSQILSPMETYNKLKNCLYDKLNDTPYPNEKTMNTVLSILKQ